MELQMSRPSEDNFTRVHKLIKKGKFAEAIAELLDPGTGRIRGEFAWDRNHAWYCIADCKLRLGDAGSAVADFKKAYRADPDDVQCLLAVGNCYDTLGKPRLAERFLRKALLLQPTGRNKAAVLVNLGNSLLDQGRWAEAKEAFAAPSKRQDDIGATAKKNRALAKSKL
jgi:Flp pilus assembly protein TadD